MSSHPLPCIHHISTTRLLAPDTGPPVPSYPRCCCSCCCSSLAPSQRATRTLTVAAVASGKKARACTLPVPNHCINNIYDQMRVSSWLPLTFIHLPKWRRQEYMFLSCYWPGQLNLCFSNTPMANSRWCSSNNSLVCLDHPAP